jgi:hypothetical protein
LVVSDDVRLLFGGREPRKLDRRDFGQADLLRSLEPRVPGYDAILAIDQDRS